MDVGTTLEGQEVLESRIMSMRWVLTWKPSDEHQQGRKAKAKIVVVGNQHPEVAETEGGTSDVVEAWQNAHTLQWHRSITLSWNVRMPRERSCRATEKRCKKSKMCTPELWAKSRVP